MDSVARAPSDMLVFIADASTHTMADSLRDYVQDKVHQDIKARKWARILVRGSYERTAPARPAENEKRQKLFNWHRPTATLIDHSTVALNCFPGASYVQHHASLVATYLALTENNPTAVLCSLPTAEQCMEPFLRSNLEDMGKADIVVVGYTYRLPQCINDIWNGREDGKLFAWQKRMLPTGQHVAYLECMISFWGDIAGYLIRALQTLNHPQCVIYLGKAGSLRPDLHPNEWIVTGDRSFIGEEVVTWDNVLAPETKTSSKVLDGDSVTVPSPLCESLEWLTQWRSRCSWVDCELGHMALAARDGKMDFGYMHIISDNVAMPHNETLANERATDAHTKRQILFEEVQNILALFFARYTGANHE
jgi:hypothetical protein